MIRETTSSGKSTKAGVVVWDGWGVGDGQGGGVGYGQGQEQGLIACIPKQLVQRNY